MQLPDDPSTIALTWGRQIEFMETLLDGGEITVNGMPWREMYERFTAVVAGGQ